MGGYESVGERRCERGREGTGGRGVGGLGGWLVGGWVGERGGVG